MVCVINLSTHMWLKILTKNTCYIIIKFRLFMPISGNDREYIASIRVKMINFRITKFERRLFNYLLTEIK